MDTSSNHAEEIGTVAKPAKPSECFAGFGVVDTTEQKKTKRERSTSPTRESTERTAKRSRPLTVPTGFRPATREDNIIRDTELLLYGAENGQVTTRVAIFALQDITENNTVCWKKLQAEVEGAARAAVERGFDFGGSIFLSPREGQDSAIIGQADERQQVTLTPPIVQPRSLNKINHGYHLAIPPLDTPPAPRAS